LQDLNSIDVFEANNAIILQKRGDVKRMFNDHQGALNDLNVDIFDPNNAFSLQSHGDIKKMLDDLDKVNVLDPNAAFTL